MSTTTHKNDPDTYGVGPLLLRLPPTTVALYHNMNTNPCFQPEPSPSSSATTPSIYDHFDMACKHPCRKFQTAQLAGLSFAHIADDFWVHSGKRRCIKRIPRHSFIVSRTIHKRVVTSKPTLPNINRSYHLRTSLSKIPNRKLAELSFAHVADKFCVVSGKLRSINRIPRRCVIVSKTIHQRVHTSKPTLPNINRSYHSLEWPQSPRTKSWSSLE